jgi:hypothetical protein
MPKDVLEHWPLQPYPANSLEYVGPERVQELINRTEPFAEWTEAGGLQDTDMFDM